MNRIRSEIAPKVAGSPAVRNAVANTPGNARMESDRALKDVLVGMLGDETELYKQFMQNEEFRKFLSGLIFDHVQEGA